MRLLYIAFLLPILLSSCFSSSLEETESRINCLNEKVRVLNNNQQLFLIFIFSHNCLLCTEEKLNGIKHFMNDKPDGHFVLLFSGSPEGFFNGIDFPESRFKNLSVYSDLSESLDACGLLKAEHYKVELSHNKVTEWQKF